MDRRQQQQRHQPGTRCVTSAAAAPTTTTHQRAVARIEPHYSCYTFSIYTCVTSPRSANCIHIYARSPKKSNALISRARGEFHMGDFTRAHTFTPCMLCRWCAMLCCRCVPRCPPSRRHFKSIGAATNATYTQTQNLLSPISAVQTKRSENDHITKCAERKTTQYTKTSPKTYLRISRIVLCLLCERRRTNRARCFMLHALVHSAVRIQIMFLITSNR